MRSIGLRPLYLAAACSGAAALLFEILLFRRLELVFGRSLEATALIFAAYMAGLALGGMLALQRGCRRHPAPWYVALEVLIAGSGLLLVIVLPKLAGLIAALPDLAGRGLGLGLLLLPTTAVGWVLPLLAQLGWPSAAGYRINFHRLYAVNTAGAVLGVLVAVPLIRLLGVRETATIAAALNLGAAGLVWTRRTLPIDLQSPVVFRPPRSPLLAATAWCGAVMLALEVIWTRAMLLEVRATDWVLSIMLAVVIGGLSLGAWLRERCSLGQWAWLAAAAALAGYWLFGVVALPRHEGLAAVALAVMLAGPCAVASGGLFGQMAVRVRAHAADSASASAWLLICNTAGAAAGSLVCLYMLLPWLGLAGVWLLAVAGFVVLAVWLAPGAAARFGGVCLLALLAVLPDRSPHWFDPAVAQFDGYRTLARREAPDASLQLASREMGATTVAYRLVTDGFSMSGTEVDSLRYMRMFAQLPQALHPGLESALLISYGLGNTAHALLADAGLRHLQVVDTSAATLELAERLPGGSPLQDSRVVVAIDDGRQFLLRSQQLYDLITAEPPPPRLAGVVNLYSQDYFDLLSRRLRPGGMVSHWLPVDQLSWSSTAAVIRGFCRVFVDCSLWAGSHYNWILLGSRGAGDEAIDEHSFSAPWAASRQRRLLMEVGLEQPAQLLTCFLADSAQLQTWVAAGEALRDDYPGRLESGPVSKRDLERYFAFMDDEATQQRFFASQLMRARVPPVLRQQAEAYWPWQPVLNGQVRLPAAEMAQIVALALRQGLFLPVLRLAGISWPELAAGQVMAEGDAAWYQGLDALLGRRWQEARQFFNQAKDPAAGNLAQVARCFEQGDC